jgi:trimethylamine:corrinoid methyltransferase-like protein
MHYTPRFNRPFSQKDLDGILTDGLRVLAKIGIGCTHRPTIDRLTAAPGVRYEGDRLHFDEAMARRHVEEAQRAGAAVEVKEPPFEVLAPWCCLEYADPRSGQVRTPTTPDAVEMARFMDARGGRNWPIPVIPADVPRRHMTLACEHIALSHTRKLGGFTIAMDPAEIEFLIEMNQAAGRTFTLVEQISISPLRFNDHGLEARERFAGRNDVRVILTGAMACVGSSAPLPIRSALVQVCAEAVALSLAGTILGGGGVGSFGGEIFPFDFQHAMLLFSGPEDMLYWSLGKQMMEFLNGQPAWGGSFHSMGRQCDPQAVAERTALALWQAIHGARRFHGAGQLAIDHVFSPQQAVIDDEIMAIVAHVVRGLDPLAGSADPVAEIAEGLVGNTFIDQPATAAGFRAVSFFPKLFHRYNVGHWHELGNPTVLAQAWEKAQEQIRSCDFHLPADRQRELDRVYAKACKTVA